MMHKFSTRMMKIAAVVVVAFSVVSCNDAPPETTLVPRLTFEQLHPVPLNVSKIEIYEDYKAPMKHPHVDHLLANRPADTVRRLMERQLVPEGTEHVLRAIIEDASVVEEKMPSGRGVISALKWNDEYRYHAKIGLRFELVDAAAPDIVKGTARVTANRAVVASSNLSLAERDRMFLTMTENLMKDVSDGLQTIVLGTFGRK